MKIEAIIFDLDGTLIDSMSIWQEIDVEFLKKRGIQVPKGLFEDVSGGNSFPEIAKHFKEKFKLSESIEEIMKEWVEMTIFHYKNTISLKPDVLELLKLCKAKNIKLGIGTSNNDQLTEIVLEKNRIKDYFQAIVTGDSITNGKPFPDIFLKTAEKLNVKPQNCLVIEDVFVGIQAAKNAGMTVFMIFDEHSIHEHDKMLEIADFYAKDYREIIEEVKNLI
ncbi:MAG: HAD family phosphatase [Candidatus Cloacimonetes bacterium]|nr:HAD family phosphatase [Candidatus Cloacimonadota bacterium]